MTKLTEAEFIKMENGKVDLPVGIARGQGSYRLIRTIGGRKYNFGSIRSLPLALKVNANIGLLVDDFRAELARKISAEDSLQTLLVENSMTDMLEITRKFNAMTEVMESQQEEIRSLRILTAKFIDEVRAGKNRSGIGRWFK